ncbi:MAG: Malate synthase G, partial [Alphaproteobacteria bacterium MarineAlpha5_Bin8]
MQKKKKIFNIEVDENLLNFINNEVLKNLSINADLFWEEFSNLINLFNPLNKKLLDQREIFQNKISRWHKKHTSREIDLSEYKSFLYDIGYIVEEGSEFKIDTTNTDPEIADISGPQLVVPITNARYSLNAVNARWGSLYDAVYGTDVLGDLPKSNSYDAKRGAKVIDYVKSYFDKILSLTKGLWKDVEKFELKDDQIFFILKDETKTQLINKNQIVGYKLNSSYNLEELIFIKNNLHIRVMINANSEIGKNDCAHISDVLFESAVSTILDCEDSVATVDTEDKILAYSNWLGLMKGDLKTEFNKDGKTIKRSLTSDINFTTFDGNIKNLKGRSLMLIRNVGHLMTINSIFDSQGKEIGEGIMDAMITSLIALYDLNKKEGNKNSNFDSIYI